MTSWASRAVTRKARPANRPVVVTRGENAVIKGADEVDMVVNLGWVKDGLFDQVTREIAAVKAACGGRPLKVIVETCYLTREEKIALCGLAKGLDIGPGGGGL